MQLADQPFVILGVNSDGADRFRKAIDKENITWRSWHDGGSIGGPIARQWNVSAWPTTYVIDAEGVIRYKNIRGENLDNAIETLLAELDVEVSLVHDEESEKGLPRSDEENEQKDDSSPANENSDRPEVSDVEIDI